MLGADLEILHASAYSQVLRTHGNPPTVLPILIPCLEWIGLRAPSFSSQGILVPFKVFLRSTSQVSMLSCDATGFELFQPFEGIGRSSDGGRCAD